MNKDNQNVIDDKNVSYELGNLIAEGAQGRTYHLKDEKYIVKLFKKSSLDESDLKSKIRFLQLLELDKSRYSIPVKLIVKPEIGYVAEFASGMMQIQDLKPNKNISDFSNWYKTSGDLLKRYMVLSDLAKSLRSIHSKGLIYCDLSPLNVFVSQDTSHSNTYLIDLDNLRYKTSVKHNIFTPFYGAPEVVTMKAPNTTMSDCFSFAVMAYELLTFRHPLIGDYVNNGEAELETDALEGKIPWIGNTKDSINSVAGNNYQCFVSNKLMSLFVRTFEEGLNDPFERPTMADWFECFNAGLNGLIRCECGHYYLAQANGCCLFCEKQSNSLVHIQIRRWEYDESKKEGYLEDRVEEEFVIDKYTQKCLKGFHLLLSDKSLSYDYKIAVISVVDYGNDFYRIKIKPCSDLKIFCSFRNGLFYSNIEKEVVLKVGKNSSSKMMLHFSELDKSQRVVTIDYKN
jgi:serine/threonine protein kinase